MSGNTQEKPNNKLRQQESQVDYPDSVETTWGDWRKHQEDVAERMRRKKLDNAPPSSAQTSLAGNIVLTENQRMNAIQNKFNRRRRW
jgi:hypothetical protein